MINTIRIGYVVKTPNGRTGVVVEKDYADTILDILVRLEEEKRVQEIWFNSLELTIVADVKEPSPQDTVAAVGLKYDSNKPDYTFVTKELMDAVSRAMGYGAKKYHRDNFKLFTKEDEKRFEAALLRHMIAYTSGEEFDPESGLSHLDHVGSTLNILLWIRGNK